ncbi:ABC transporter substrate-binding protein [Ruania halotolerans]|uniref:ABC transporter substrate-binding protein n=1 Tax=Ruania halotolerans TaxID=2897773 RepID=UPI001E430124|nr:substrate-binding domain-containing protein [Ruania halotolerans]UFU07106.1 substrate-binding domain-containing protein [Ruania halotolerans]
MPTSCSSPPPGLSRRSFLAGAGLASAGLTLGGCGSSAEAAEITFYQSKPEVIPYFGDLVHQFGTEHPGVRVRHDSTSNLSGGFVRSSPPDLGCLNYNFEVARFVDRGALSDLSDLPAAGRINPDLQPLVELTANYPGRTSVLPYSLMMASVLYNREIFAEHRLEVPTTWDELIEICETLSEAGVTPIYSTFADPWTVGQGLLDYCVGGMVDVSGFFTQLAEQGTEVGPDSPVSFQKDFAEPVQRMLTLASYSNDDAASRGYGDGNLAFAGGEAAMYLQGPWALTEIAKTNESMDVGAFPLPMTDSADDLRVRVNVDLALWIPEMSSHQAEARELLTYLMQPEIIDAYNEFANGFGVTTDAPDVTNPTLQELQSFYDDAAFYLGATQLIPQSIPVHNYAQALVTGSDPDQILRTLDADWARLAFRS